MAADRTGSGSVARGNMIFSEAVVRRSWRRVSSAALGERAGVGRLAGGPPVADKGERFTVTGSTGGAGSAGIEVFRSPGLLAVLAGERGVGVSVALPATPLCRRRPPFRERRELQRGGDQPQRRRPTPSAATRTATAPSSSPAAKHLRPLGRGLQPLVSGSGNTFNGAAARRAGRAWVPGDVQPVDRLFQPRRHTQGTTLTISSGTPSGIYCYTGSITLSESNLTATVTLVAPSITLSGSSLNLTPAYQDLLAYDTNTTVGNTGMTVSGSSITTHGGTVYAPYAAVNLSGAKYAWDGMIEGDTITISGAQSTYTGEGPLPTGTNFTISGNAPSLLYPGAAKQSLNLTIANPNSGSISVSSLTVTVSGVSGGMNSPHACTVSGDFKVVQINPSALPFTAPSGDQHPQC